jgi:hypothetical protein
MAKTSFPQGAHCLFVIVPQGFLTHRGGFVRSLPWITMENCPVQTIGGRSGIVHSGAKLPPIRISLKVTLAFT